MGIRFPNVIVAVGCAIAVLAATLLARAAPSGNPLVLGDAGTYDVAPYAQVYTAIPGERVEQYEALRAAGRFDEPAPDTKARLHAGGHVWVVFRVRAAGTADARSDWVLSKAGAAQSLDAMVRVDDRTRDLFHNGFFVQPQHRPLQAVGYAFPIQLQGDRTAEIVLQGYLPPREGNDLSVLPASRFRFINLIESLLLFGVIGAAFALGFYNAVLYFVVRERAYSYYAQYAFGSVLLWSTTYSVVNLFITDGRVSLMLNGASAIVVVVTSIRFTREFLELRRIAPRYDRVMTSLLYVIILLLPAVLFVPQPTWKLIAAILSIPTLLAVSFAPVYALIRGHRLALLMVVGWVPLMTLPLLIGLRLLGIIEGAWVTKNLLLVFHGFEILTMALAIADRFRRLDADRARAQKEALEQLNLRLEEREQLARAELASRSANEATERERVRGSTDALTGLRNRRAFDSERPRVNAEWARDPTADVLVCVIDIDGLKKLNDTLGHAAGDRMLAQFGRCLGSSLRESDRTYRVGGDEFTVFARAPDEAGQKAILRKIRAAIDQLKVEFAEVDASVGTALLSEVAGSVVEAYRLADERMYVAKRARATARLASAAAPGEEERPA